MPEHTDSHAGHFVWHDLMTTDPRTAVAFLNGLLGWETREMDMGPDAGTYTIFSKDGREFGGMVALKAADGIPPHWVPYITVDDVDAAAEQIAEQGGQVVYGPFDIPNVGRSATAMDATGAVFAPFTDLHHQLPGPPALGTIAWNELLTTDADAEKPFYHALCRWGVRGQDMGEMGTYWLFQRDGRDVAGLMQMPPDAASPSNWLPYIGVADVVGTVAKAQSLGATVQAGPIKMGDPIGVHFAVLRAPDGAFFGVLEIDG